MKSPATFRGVRNQLFFAGFFHFSFLRCLQDRETVVKDIIGSEGAKSPCVSRYLNFDSGDERQMTRYHITKHERE